MSTAKERREAREREAQEREATEAQERETVRRNQEFMENPGAVASAHGSVEEPTSAGAKVTVGCKLAVAWLDLQLSRTEEVMEQGLGTTRMVKEGRRIGGVTVRIRGTAYPRGTVPEGFPPPPLIVAGVAMNPGVDKAFWDEWVKQNHLNPIVMNRLIFAHENENMVHGKAREEASILSGLEPMNPKGDVRTPRATRGDMTDVEPDDRRRATRV